MKYKISDIIVGFVFAGLLIGMGYMQGGLKNAPQIYMILWGLITLVTLHPKISLKISFPFYILLGVMLYVNIFIVTNLFVNVISPDDGWVVDEQGERHRVMQMNWIWGILFGFILAPVFVILYHKLIKRNKPIEISFVLVFILVTTIIYVINELI